MFILLVLDIFIEVCFVVLFYEGCVFSYYEVILCLYVQCLLLMVCDLFDEVGVVLFVVDVIVFGCGLGVFIGVCIVIGVVQGLVFVLQCLVLVVFDLVILVQWVYCEQGVEWVVVVIDVWMDEVYWGCYQL